MGNIFAGSEIVELGIQIEKNGRDFYASLINTIKDSKVRKMFQFLASEEEKHIVIFQGILKDVEQYEPAESYPGEYFAYMNALASGYVFTQKGKGREIARQIKGEKEAIDLGMGFEKDSIIFYEGMKKTVPGADINIIDELIGEEEKHFKILFDLKSKL